MNNIHTRTWIAIAISLTVIGYVFWQGIWSPIAHRLSNSAASAEVGANTADVGKINFTLPGTEEDNQNKMNENQAIPNLPDNQIGVIDVKLGEGREARPGDTVQVHYDGFLMNGTQFDSSRARGTPFSFALGSGQVIQGFDMGIVGMKEGAVRRIVIPPKLGYGEQTAGQIPPNSTLLFEVELIKVGK